MTLSSFEYAVIYHPNNSYTVSILLFFYQHQENEGSEALSKLTAMDTDGFSLEEEEGSEVEEGEGRQRKDEDQDSSEKQVDFHYICCLKFPPMNRIWN